MEALKCHFTRALISVMGVNPTVERNENKTYYLELPTKST